jgi:hypothetical protein
MSNLVLDDHEMGRATANSGGQFDPSQSEDWQDGFHQVISDLIDTERADEDSAVEAWCKAQNSSYNS